MNPQKSKYAHVAEGKCRRRCVGDGSNKVSEVAEADTLGSDGSREHFGHPDKRRCFDTLDNDDV